MCLQPHGMTTPGDFSNEGFSDYLRSLCDSDAPWWKTYAFMDEIDHATWFEFELDSKTHDKSKQPGEEPTERTLPVLKAIEDYTHEKLLIVGSPGAGKSTLLSRLLWQAAQKAQQNATAPIPLQAIDAHCFYFLNISGTYPQAQSIQKMDNFRIGRRGRIDRNAHANPQNNRQNPSTRSQFH